MRIDIGPGDDLVAIVRRADAESVVVVIAARPALDMAMARAAIAPLAIARAPGGRLNAVLPGSDADPSDVDTAVAFLDQARATTGQLLEIG